MAFRLDQAPLVDFCNQHSPRAHSRYRPIPASWWNERALAHVARRPRHGEAAGCAGELYPSLSTRASHDDGSLHLRDGWRPRAGSTRAPPCGGARSRPPPCGDVRSRALSDTQEPALDEACAPSSVSTGCADVNRLIRRR